MALLGISHLFMMASQQMLCIRCAGPRGRDAVFGNYLVASAIGQGLGPYIIAWSSGTARLPPTDRLYAIGLLISFASLVTAAAMRPAPKPKAHEHSAAVVPVRTLMRQRGLMAVLIASVITITAQDLLVIYLPLLGAANNITARDIGTLAHRALGVLAGVAHGLCAGDPPGRPRAVDARQHDGGRDQLRLPGSAHSTLGDVRRRWC